MPGPSAFSPVAHERRRWRPWEGDGLQQFDFRREGDGYEAIGAVVAEDDVAYLFRFRLRDDWTPVHVDVDLTSGKSVRLKSDGKGKWTDGAGKPLPDLDGCIDFDLNFSPITNTLPIRRLSWEIGQSREMRMAFVAAPDLQVFADGQRYTRLSEDRFHYEATDGSFEAEISVDTFGLVSQYPSLFRPA